MKLMSMRAATAALIPLALCGIASAFTLPVDLKQSRSRDEIELTLGQALRAYNLRLALLSDQVRLARNDQEVFSMPVRVDLQRNGTRLGSRAGKSRGVGDAITLQFDTSGSRAFPLEYRNYLQSVFNSSKAAIEAVFGPPTFSGVVKVLNYDADIPARQAVSGGFYAHNGPTGPEIRFPVYQSGTAAAINFIHTIMLAYLGDIQYPFDAYDEGLVRAATMAVARSGGSIPSTTPELVESTLDSLYDASSVYDWSNAPGLGAPQFIAPNLLTAPLPAGGSTGGIFLLRHQMAGAAWSKVLAQYPGFIKEFNRRYELNPPAYQTETALVALGQVALNTVAGTSGATVEGLSFKDWTDRQFVLDTSVNAGLKVVPQAFPVSPTGGSSDFGVFGIVVNAFRTLPNGNETLLDGTCYPAYWRPDFTRFFTTAQDDVAQVAGAYGSVVPNFPQDTFGGQVYRVAVDLPFLGKNARVNLPAGAVATGSSTTPNTFYGTLTGFPIEAGVSYGVSVSWVGGSANSISVQNFAFGAKITASTFEPAQPVTVRVFRLSGSSATEVATRRVNKGFGPLVVDLRSDNCFDSMTISRPDRLTTLGMTIQPFRANPLAVFQGTTANTLVARYNPFNGLYDLFPNEAELRSGLGYFARTSGLSNVTVNGLNNGDTPTAVSLQAGWNLVSVPFDESVPTTGVQVTTGSQSTSTYAQALGDVLGTTFFRFVPDGTNPDLGTLQAATGFSPGQAYFVRALKPEGALLLFTPAASRTRSASPLTSGQTEPSAVAGLGFSGSMEFWSTKGQYAEVRLTQKVGANAAVDLKEDSELAPGPGGFQIASMVGRALFEDVRPFQVGTTYSLKMTGLVPGQWYSLTWKAKSGSPKFQVGGGGGTIITSNSGYQFRASSTTMDLQVTTR